MNGARPVLPLPHHHGYLCNPLLPHGRIHDRFRLRVVCRIVLRKCPDGLAPDRPEPARHIPHLLCAQQMDQPRQEPDSGAPCPGRLKSLARDKPGTDDVIGGILLDRPDDVRDVLRIMLPVPVELDRDVISVPVCVQISRLNRSADPEVYRKAHVIVMPLLQDLLRPVRRSVIDHDIVISGIVLNQIIHHGLDILFFVVRRDHDKYARIISVHHSVLPV